MKIFKKTILFLLMLSSALAAYCSADGYDRFHNFRGQVAKMVITNGEDVETVFFDEEGMKIFAELSYTSGGSRIDEIAAFDNSGVRVIYRQVNGNSNNIQTKVYPDYKHKDHSMAQPVDLSGKFKNGDKEGNWTLYEGAHGKNITRELVYYADPEASELIKKANNNRQMMFEQNDITTDVFTVDNIAVVLGGLLLGLIFGLLTLVTIVFGLLCLISYDRVRNFFNKRAGDTILPKKLRLHKQEAVVAIIGGIYGISLWSGTLFGSSTSILFSIFLFGVIVYGFIYFRRLYHKILRVASPKACKWYMIYTLLAMCCCFVLGALASVVGIAIIVYSLAGKGMLHIWDDEYTHKLPVSDGSSSTRKCAVCPDYENGYCRYHNRQMPVTGGCGVR